MHHDTVWSSLHWLWKIWKAQDHVRVSPKFKLPPGMRDDSVCFLSLSFPAPLFPLCSGPFSFVLLVWKWEESVIHRSKIKAQLRSTKFLPQCPRFSKRMLIAVFFIKNKTKKLFEVKKKIQKVKISNLPLKFLFQILQQLFSFLYFNEVMERFKKKLFERCKYLKTQTLHDCLVLFSERLTLTQLSFWAQLVYQN